MSQGLEHLDEALIAGLKRLAQGPGLSSSGELAKILDEALHSAPRNDLLQVAALLNEFGRLGEEERKTGLKILAAFAEYSQNRRRRGRGIYTR